MSDIHDFMYHERPFVTVREFLAKMGVEEKDMVDTNGNPVNEDLCYTNMYFWSPALKRQGKGWQQRVDNGKLVMTFVATPVNWEDIDLNDSNMVFPCIL